MKPIHIIGIVVIAIAIAIIVGTIGDASQYVNFEEAAQMAAKGSKKKIHVVGTLQKDAAGKIVGMHYNAQENPNYFSFTMVDQNKNAKQVVYNNPKPADFERSEQVVVVGYFHKDKFVAEKILMKCPSKYQEGKYETKEVSTQKI
ncbi:MAG TPA: cytochrome C biogenesis protein [Microscillaceae bacterium]|jgi:cytochrome c-type biogenesis protein CcmE|nr:cytochrome C biogenesis protein [Microscillaceae bacterium]